MERWRESKGTTSPTRVPLERHVRPRHVGLKWRRGSAGPLRDINWRDDPLAVACLRFPSRRRHLQDAIAATALTHRVLVAEIERALGDAERGASRVAAARAASNKQLASLQQLRGSASSSVTRGTSAGARSGADGGSGGSAGGSPESSDSVIAKARTALATRWGLRMAHTLFAFYAPSLVTKLRPRTTIPLKAILRSCG